jgi:hypothetical protein
MQSAEKQMTVTVTNIMPGANTTYMFRKRPRRQQTIWRQAVISVVGVVLASGIVVWFALA